MANRMTDVIKSIWNSRTTTPIADIVALLQTVVWNFAAGLNVTGATALTGSLHVTGASALDGAITTNGKLTVTAGGASVVGGTAVDALTINAGTPISQFVEGTFTPVITGTTVAGAGTYSFQQGFYTRVGNRVFFNMVLQWSAHTGTGNISITGMPFTSNSAAANYTAVTCVSSTLNIPNTDAYYLGPNQAFISVLNGTASQSMQTTGNLILTGNYRI